MMCNDYDGFSHLMDAEYVVSPYSSFLALSVDLKASLQNLRNLQKLGAEGRYGFFEAVDYTPSRLRSNEFEIVKTYMAHHVGMSLVSICNVLHGDVMQKRFMKDSSMAAFGELLQEKVPVGGVTLRSPPRDVPEKPRRAAAASWSFESSGIDSVLPRIGLLGNGAYTVMMAETGQSRSVWNGLQLTRSSDEPSGRDAGMAFFLKCGDELVSLLPSPVFDPNVRYGVQMAGAMCRITAKSGGLDTSVAVMVPQGDAGELRTVEISSDALREAELICYFEPVLSRKSDYESHPAFSKMSLETSRHDGAIVIRRRPRAKDRALTLAFGCDSPYEFDTSREKALGRGGILSLPAALRRKPERTVGSVLDPCVLMRVKLRLEPGSPCRVSFALAPSWSAEGAAQAVARILESGGHQGSRRLDDTARRLGLSLEQVDSAMALASEIIYPCPDRRVPSELLSAQARGQSGMWSLGVSGDYPILTATVRSESAEHDLARAQELIKAHAFLSENGVSFELVFLLSDGGDYHGKLKNGVADILRSMNLERRLGARCGVHTAQLESEGADAVLAASFRVIGVEPNNPRERDEKTAFEPLVFYAAQPDKPLEHGYNEDDSFTFLCDGVMPPNAWSHVLSNGEFGYIASDSGTGHMWHFNARENKINRWYNDSLATEGTERLYLVADGVKTSLFAAPDGHPCRVTYGFGYARWEKTIGNVNVKLTAFVPRDTACRVFLIETDAPPQAEILYCTDLVLGSSEHESVFVTTTHSDGVIEAHNSYSADFSDTVFTHLASQPGVAFTCSKSEFLTGRLDGTVGTGFMPCIAALYPAHASLAIVSGCADQNKLRALADHGAAEIKLRETVNYWRDVTSRFNVKTPCADLDRYLNGWAVYQTLACRIFGRSSLYQSGGAYGFRDQLQDVCALTAITPDEAHAQIIRAAEHQYEQGDVQHWWHPGSERDGLGSKGVRTKCSDDLLWLPYALCEYVDVTGDDSICDCPARYLSSPTLGEDELERYEQPRISDKVESVFAHALRAIELVLARGAGSHGLALIGSGDWNDGMNLVGAGGRGESVWLTWFLIHTARRFAELCERRDNPGAAKLFREAVKPYLHAAENAWDGNWYLRGYFDDGTPLGSRHSDECKIDSIAQSFAALADAEPDRIKTALTGAVEMLFDRGNRVIKLFDPPFDKGRTSPGYIKGYSPGFRENGGQYTHSAIWLAMALLKSGMTELGWETLQAILPQNRPVELYRTEPYVLAADVYSNPQHLGRGGWTWYTGASGWYYRIAMESLLGLRVKNGVLHIRPNLPPGWDGFRVTWKNGDSEYLFNITRDGNVSITRDGTPVHRDPSVAPSGETVEFTEN